MAHTNSVAFSVSTASDSKDGIFFQTYLLTKCTNHFSYMFSRPAHVNLVYTI